MNPERLSAAAYRERETILRLRILSRIPSWEVARYSTIIMVIPGTPGTALLLQEARVPRHGKEFSGRQLPKIVYLLTIHILTGDPDDACCNPRAE
jgi:hypothetical protein